ncbi:hypothetical protein DTO021D3_6427 [Paecilomyces variotii]|nr:hypothetical protein DTO021D3_6427 [Paecilomyces variotii]
MLIWNLVALLPFNGGHANWLLLFFPFEVPLVGFFIDCLFKSPDMKLNLAPICALLLAGPISSVLAKNLLADQLFRRGLDIGVGDAALEIAERELFQEKRAALPEDDSGVNVVSRADNAGAAAASNFNETAFNATAVKACDSALSAMKSAVNPSGIVACYNIPFYDNTTGVFQTDLRLYQMNQPVDEFAGTKPTQYSMQITIPEATLSSPKSMISGPIQSKTSGGQTIQMLQGFTSVGQLNDKLSTEKLTADDLRVIMIPNITMSTNNPVTSNLISTTLSSDTISYVAGQLAQPNGTPTNITFPEAMTRTTAILFSATKFSYPGTHILVNPIGGIITGIWCGLFIATVGLGTIGRYRFRQAYRERAARAMAGSAPKGF